MSVDEAFLGDKQERFEFVRDSPDLVAQMLALRTELLMQIYQLVQETSENRIDQNQV